MKKNFQYILAFTFSVIILGACSYSRHPDSIMYDPNDPGFEYAPAMYHSWPYEPLTQVTDPDQMSWKKNSNAHNDYKGKYNMNEMKPVEGSIARGKLDYYYPYADDNNGYESAGINLHNPIKMNDANLKEGRRLFNLYCDHCHGAKGDGNGTIVEAGKFPTMGSYDTKLKDLPAGKIYHVVTYGKGIMGSHASQLSPEQRWLIVTWVQVMQKSADGYKVNTMADYNDMMMSMEKPATETSMNATEAMNDATQTMEIQTMESAPVSPETLEVNIEN